MNRIPLSIAFLSVALTVAAMASDAPVNALQTTKTGPKVEDPETSALAPMPSMDDSLQAKDVTGVRRDLPKNHDDDLFESPQKSDANPYPFGEDVIGRPRAINSGGF
jgi:hypothetical protein